ncbi:GNAT family N-acetyltransferase [Streptomyces sp. LX-29]|uniref:GNAT family N-acetyltransferase n=1 Tax=Streptomyces sp. LX-29 TaxID=2900152 RepID=UPI0032193988
MPCSGHGFPPRHPHRPARDPRPAQGRGEGDRPRHHRGGRGVRALLRGGGQRPTERDGRAGEGDGTVIGCLQLTYIPGLGRRGEERALIEAVRIRADRRGGGLGCELLRWAIERARARGCTLVQLTSNKRRTEAHRFYDSLRFARSHGGFNLAP